MNIKKVLEKIDTLPDKEMVSLLKNETTMIISLLESEIGKQKIGAEVFIGGSFAKGTLVKKSEYDIDIFVRFDWRYENLTEELEGIIESMSKKMKLSYTKLHGSRDYFRIRKGDILFEIIPVLNIKNPGEARNVTDLSYFHVKYARGKVNPRIAREIVIAKTFCKAQGVYGAESYICGFSGYALECLIIHYKSFEKMLRELVKPVDRLIIDPEKKYKNKNDAVINLNESKLKSPVILIDPTWKERNILAALHRETFSKFQNSAKAFLKKPSLKFFEEQKIDLAEIKNSAKKKKAEFLHLSLKTDKQEGDIAGTKLKKFTNFVSLEIGKFFNIIRKEFVYDDLHSADVYLVVSSKKEIVKIGPPVSMKDAVRGFKKANKKTFIKNGLLHSKIKVNFSAKRFLEQWKQKYARKVKEMDITEMKID